MRQQTPSNAVTPRGPTVFDCMPSVPGISGTAIKPI